LHKAEGIAELPCGSVEYGMIGRRHIPPEVLEELD
jgi:hypothetical protein